MNKWIVWRKYMINSPLFFLITQQFIQQCLYQLWQMLTVNFVDLNTVAGKYWEFTHLKFARIGKHRFVVSFTLWCGSAGLSFFTFGWKDWSLTSIWFISRYCYILYASDLLYVDQSCEDRFNLLGGHLRACLFLHGEW